MLTYQCVNTLSYSEMVRSEGKFYALRMHHTHCYISSALRLCITLLMSIRTICASVCASVKLAFLVWRTWTWICVNIPNYINIYMYHLNDPTHARTLEVCTYSIHRLCSRWGIYNN